MNEAPAIEVYIVQNFEPPGGRTSAIVPAVANAIFSARGDRRLGKKNFQESTVSFS
jgi:hypothetical protein